VSARDCASGQVGVPVGDSPRVAEVRLGSEARSQAT
jgi:hypothetical protein